MFPPNVVLLAGDNVFQPFAFNVLNGVTRSVATQTQRTANSTRQVRLPSSSRYAPAPLFQTAVEARCSITQVSLCSGRSRRSGKVVPFWR